MDVDYKQLIEKKCKVVRETEAIRNLCGKVVDSASATNVLYEGTSYVAIAADLQSKSDLLKLKEVLSKHGRHTLFLAEVSLTYVPSEAVSEIISWASSFPQGQCLLMRAPY